MASMGKFAARNCYRITYRLTFGAHKKKPRYKYSKSKEEARVLTTQLEQLEIATRTRIARQVDIEKWIDQGWLKPEEAEEIFDGYKETLQRTLSKTGKQTDYKRIERAFSDYSASIAKGGAFGRPHARNLNHARLVFEWLRADIPRLTDLSQEQIKAKILHLRESGYSPWTLHHFLTKLRLIIDQAIPLGEMATNPARQISLRRDLNIRTKPNKPHRDLTLAEIEQLLDACTRYPQYLNGALAVVVANGLYAGLRREEIAWQQWTHIDWDRRVIHIQETICGLTKTKWLPKDYEERAIDVKPRYIALMRAEYERQEQAGLLGQFAIPAGSWKRRTDDDRLKPIYPDSISKSFSKMIKDEKMDTDITVQSLRHSYITWADRSHISLFTIQDRAGHADIRTTQNYGHARRVEEHPMDELPY
jgi:integrase